MAKYNYHREELNRIDTKNQYAPTFQIKDSTGNKTNNIDLNKRSAKELISWLVDNMENLND